MKKLNLKRGGILTILTVAMLFVTAFTKAEIKPVDGKPGNGGSVYDDPFAKPNHP